MKVMILLVMKVMILQNTPKRTKELLRFVVID